MFSTRDGTGTTTVEAQIVDMVNRETNAWNECDAEALVSLFHPDMVWAWPKDEHAHDPVDWVCPLGRYDKGRWKAGWCRLFDTYALEHNRRDIVKITVTSEGDGAFAVVDVDTLWRHRTTREPFHWKGRACKIYTKVGSGWKLIAHTGLLHYPR